MQGMRSLDFSTMVLLPLRCLPLREEILDLDLHPEAVGLVSIGCWRATG